MDMPLDLAHISVACFAWPQRRMKAKIKGREENRKRKDERKGPNLGKEERKNKSQSVLLRYTTPSPIVETCLLIH